MMKCWCFLLALFPLFLSIAGFSQQVSVTLKAVDNKNEAIAFASFTVIKRNDSLQLQQKVSDSSGAVKFLLDNGEPYVVKISSVNFQPLEKGITIKTGHQNFTFTLQSSMGVMQGVTVTAAKPLMRQEDDKTILDPEPIAAASTNAYEILEKTPGIFVDQDGNVYLSSMTPATILINGRDMKMSVADISTMLKNLPPNAISKIEIMRTPSAKYDASSTGGLINIILKKGVKLGMTGNVVAGLQQGVYGNQFVSFNLSNNTENKRSYINLNFNNRNNFETIATDRYFKPDSLLSQLAKTLYPGQSFFFSYGLGYDLGSKWEMEYDGRLSLNYNDNKTYNRSIIKNINDNNVKTDNLTDVDNVGNAKSLVQEFSAKEKIDTSGSEWTNDLFLLFSRNESNQDFTTQVYVPMIVSASGGGVIVTNRTAQTAESNLKLKMNHRLILETGGKISLLQFNNGAEYFTMNNGSQIKDYARTNKFKYNEDINALYLQTSKTLGRNVIIKVGARLENTNMNGHQLIPLDTSFEIHRTDIFPYLYLSKKVMSIAGYELRSYLVLRRTITRPVYEQLNPFPRFVDQYLTEVGNPTLRPQFNTNYEANISVDERPLLAVGVNDTKDIFTNVIYQADSNQAQAYRTFDNLGKNKEFYMRGLGAIPPGKRYFFVLGAQYNHNFYQGQYEKEPLSYKKGSWTFFTYHQLRLDRRSQFTLNGFIRLKGQQQLYELGNFGSLNATVNRQFLKQKLIVTLSANDIFYTNKNTFTIHQGTVDANGYRKTDSRRFGINLRYNFGIRKKEDNKDLFDVESPER
jgi:outer membrane beta-barrel protein/TonB-dependent receptor-like protein